MKKKEKEKKQQQQLGATVHLSLFLLRVFQSSSKLSRVVITRARLPEVGVTALLTVVVLQVIVECSKKPDCPLLAAKRRAQSSQVEAQGGKRLSPKTTFLTSLPD